jgi:Outer membrane protein beta-barrel domain
MRSFALAVTALALGIGPLHAQHTQPAHEGFWIGFGLGVGSDLSSQAKGARGGGAGYLRMGGTVNPLLSIGGEVAAWGRTTNGTTVSRANAVGAVYFYPVQSSGLYLKSGIGFATAQAAVTGGGVTTTVSQNGFGATFGAGYEIPIGHNLVLSPNADLLTQIIKSHSESLFLLTIGLTWH